MLDGINLEAAGVPAAAIVTDQFVKTAQLYCKLNGVPDYRFAVVSHPISNRDEQGYQALVDQVLPQVLDILRGGK